MAAVRFAAGFLEGLIRFFPAVFACLFALGAIAQDARLTLLDVRFGPSAERTRIVLDLKGVVAHRTSLDASAASVMVDLPSTAFALKGVAPGSGSAKGRGVVGSYDYGPAADGLGSRLVFDLAEPSKVLDVFVLPPQDGLGHSRLVIDLAPAALGAMAAQDGAIWGAYEPIVAVRPAPPPEARLQLEEPAAFADAAPAPSVKPQQAARVIDPPVRKASDRKVIVIDAGHGGRDPGAIGRGGTREKAVTLATALKLRDALNRTGRYEIVLTRDDDTYLRLDERAEIARAAHADLFLSIHADALAGNVDVRGASVWTLSETGSKRIANAVSRGDYIMFDDSIANEEVGVILFDLAQRETKNQSARFAQLLIPELGKVAPLVGNTHRTAAYRVLLSPDVPAVLLELAFLSNAADEKNLSNAAWRERMAFAVADAIDGYFEFQPAVRHASAQ
ncbi:MAG: N-acetylmuramoyl-L-alanine amidase [Pseudomonadota bacterium]